MPTKKKTTKLLKKDLDLFKNLLTGQKAEIIHDIKNLQKDSKQDGESKDLSGHVMHMADVATDMYDKEFSLNLASKDRDLLNKIDDALKRIDDGTYGICLGTGKSISKERLKALPYAEYCLEHQEELENEK